MTVIFVATAALVLCAFAELALPGKELYHYGWFNVLLIALAVIVLMSLARATKSLASKRARAAVVACAAGGILAALATVASGLLGPDTQTVVAAPGASVRIDSLGGSLMFPLAQPAGAPQSRVVLMRGNRPTEIGRRRVEGPFLLASVPRDVVAIDATDAKGAHVTITQPTGNTFLSPVLLMQSTQTIAGMALPYDTFAVPALHRVVKAVLFNAEQAARLPGLAGAQHAVLFDVEDQDERSLKNGIGVSRDGQAILLAGLRLRATVLPYPAVQIVSVPDVRVMIACVVVMLVGAGLWFTARAPASARPAST